MAMMSGTHYQSYLEAEILSADALRLVKIVYQVLLDTVLSARTHLQAGQIAERSAAISKAVALLQELATSLNHESGGEISRNLVELYDYMQRQLLRANTEQSDAPLAEVHRLLGTLLEAWQTLAEPSTVETAALPAGSYDEPATYRSVSYSF